MVLIVREKSFLLTTYDIFVEHHVYFSVKWHSLKLNFHLKFEHE